MKLSANINFSWSKNTEFGYTTSRASECFIDKYNPLRDIDTVERAVTLLKKFFAKKDFNSKEVVLSYYDLDSDTGIHDVARIYEVWNGYNIIIYKGVGAYSDIHMDKLTIKNFRELYLNCADCALKYKAENERETVGA